MWKIVVLAVVSLVVLAACSSDDEAEPAALDRSLVPSTIPAVVTVVHPAGMEWVAAG